MLGQSTHMTQNVRLFIRFLIFSIPAMAGPLLAAEAKKPPQPAYADPAKTDADFPLQGEFTGLMQGEKFAMQIVALGKGEFDGVLCPGGLPGDGWSGSPGPRQKIRGKREGDNGSIRFPGNGWAALGSPNQIIIQDLKGEEIGRLARIERKSPTLGLAPPAGAIAIFDGESAGKFKPGARITAEGLLMEGCNSIEEFGDCTLHIEFRLPYMPESRGQGRGNSGLYLAGRYEVQMLDSFGLTGENNECGGIYTVAKPKVNMCYPPLAWQTYDIVFKAPRFDDNGKKTADAELTVRHNGVLVHEQVKAPKPTAAAISNTEAPKGPIHLQNHGNPVRYRNIWVLPTLPH